MSKVSIYDSKTHIRLKNSYTTFVSDLVISLLRINCVRLK